LYLSKSEKAVTSETLDAEVDANVGLNKALDTYRKLIEKNVTIQQNHYQIKNKQSLKIELKKLKKEK